MVSDLNQTADDTLPPHVVRTERELVWSPSGWEHVLIIVTDIPVDPGHADHDPGAIHKMTDLVTAGLRAKGLGFHKLIIRNDHSG